MRRTWADCTSVYDQRTRETEGGARQMRWGTPSLRGGEHCEAAVREDVCRGRRESVGLETKRVDVTASGWTTPRSAPLLRKRGTRQPDGRRDPREGEAPARRRGHDVRLLRRADRTQAQQGRRRGGHVNYATQAASVSFDPASVSVDDLIATVEATGYHAALPSDVTETPDAARTVRTAPCRCGADGSAITMVPPFQFDGWEWVALYLRHPSCSATLRATFHRATLLRVRHHRRWTR